MGGRLLASTMLTLAILNSWALGARAQQDSDSAKSSQLFAGAVEEPFSFEQNTSTTFESRFSEIWAAAFRPDGKTVAIASGKWDRPGYLKIYDVETRKELVNLAAANNAWIRCLAFTPDGKTLATAENSELKLRDPATGDEMRTIKCKDGRIDAFAFSPDGKFFATAKNDQVRVFDLEKGAEQWHAKAHAGGCYAVAYSTDGKWVATGGADAQVKSWDTATHKELKTFKPPKAVPGSFNSWQ